MKSTLFTKYQKEAAPKLAAEFGIKNKMAIPSLEKVVLNVGVGEIAKNKESLELAKRDLAEITGQFPSVRPAKISVASFSVRTGMPVGLFVTLRGEHMWAFLQRLFSIVLPRFRDFRGLSDKSFDKGGNYTLGIEEFSVFPEIDLAKPHALKGLEATIVVKGSDAEKSRKLLGYLGMPFEKKE
ncbi:MAG: 50S ribosomal protein L5 [Candidatus Woesebacteria bacterium GW2011_GWA1_45_8]|uniref:Large ribosomal subunit protein uL5 n=1 Tax=Candidatus Woesebacteria bacterium GW2011_GWA1_45_8 TaxID=1618559 RepID=A0A0G1MVH1_9BACT|nr:MAG: 50S ribosomal protein L5 [Candidatus Woesebacteria bacterium GW2011_GWA1_45_8]